MITKDKIIEILTFHLKHTSIQESTKKHIAVSILAEVSKHKEVDAYDAFWAGVTAGREGTNENGYYSYGDEDFKKYFKSITDGNKT